MFDMDVRDREDTDVSRHLRARGRSPRRIAALDLGSRSFHLVVAELQGDEEFAVVSRAKERLFLGESVFTTGEIDDETFERGVAAVRRLRELALEHDPVAVTAVATAAVREARNGRAFVRAIHERAGIDVRIIDGLEEARLALLGARRELGMLPGRTAIVDFGAGSTEVVVADAERCHLTASIPFGALRLEARLGRIDVLDPKQLARLQEQVAEDLACTVAHMQLVGFDRLVLSCGTARRLVRRISAHWPEERIDPELTRVDLVLLQRAAQDRASSLTEGFDVDEREELVVGATALLSLLERMAVDAARVVSSGLREGLIADYLMRTRSSVHKNGGLVSVSLR